MTHRYQTTKASGPPRVGGAAIDPALPEAWARVADYLDTYGNDDGVLGRRKTSKDRVAEFTTRDLRVILGALETITYGIADTSLSEVHRKLDRLLELHEPKDPPRLVTELRDPAAALAEILDRKVVRPEGGNAGA